MELATIKDNPYKLALRSELYKDTKKGEATKFLIDLISKCYYDCGQVMPGYDTNAQKNALQILTGATHEEIIRYFPFIRIQEVKIAFENGCRKDYGDFFGINVATFNLWIKGYLADQRRKDAKLKIEEENKQPVKPLLSVTEAEYEWKQAMIKQFEDFKATGVLKCELPNYQFTEFEKRGLITLNKTEKEFIWEQAKDKVIELHKLKRLNPKSIKERDISTKRINEIMCNQMSVETKAEVQNTARRTGIENYYLTITKLEL